MLGTIPTSIAKNVSWRQETENSLTNWPIGGLSANWWADGLPLNFLIGGHPANWLRNKQIRINNYDFPFIR